MTYRRRHRWLRRIAFGLAFAAIVSPAAAKVDEGGSGGRYVSAGGWSGPVDPETGVPLSAGIVGFDEAPIEVIPYLSHGILTEADRQAAAAEAIHDPYLTDVFVRQGESLGGPDGNLSMATLGEAVKSRQAPAPFVQGVTDFPKAAVAQSAVRPDDRADRFTGIEQPRVISYLSHGMGNAGDVGARPDDRADRFALSDAPAVRTELASSGTTLEWDSGLSLAIGGIVLGLALGLGLGYLSRPRLVGA